MKIINKTKLDTRQLKRIVCRAITESVRGGEPRRTKQLTIVIIYSKKWFSGYAYYNGFDMTLRIPRQDGFEINDSKEFAQLVMHEYDHIIGYRHKQMGGRHIGHNGYNVDWVTDDYNVALKERKVKVKPDIKEVRYQRVVKTLKRKQTQIKRLETSIKKLLRKQRYYENKKGIEIN